MLRNNIGLVLLLLLTSCTEKDTASSFDFIDSFESEYIATRSIQIYVPPSYNSSNQSYPVLYMHDGQMLFDSTTTWNGQEWGVDETMDRLIAKGTLKETIVVGIWNGGSELRHPEYFPQKPFESLDKFLQDSIYGLFGNENTLLFGNPIQSDDYLKFLVEELKPFIDSAYSTKPSRDNTFISGSSMGGLISMYAICEYPDVFGGAACLSTHWPGIYPSEKNPVPQKLFNYLIANLPDPDTHKIYFDYGTETLDAFYEPFQSVADSIFSSSGYSVSNFLSKKFNGDAHDEKSWNHRLHIPLTFLLAKQ